MAGKAREIAIARAVGGLVSALAICSQTNPMHGKIDHHLQIRDQQDSSLTGYAEFRWGRCAAREARPAVWQRAH